MNERRIKRRVLPKSALDGWGSKRGCAFVCMLATAAAVGRSNTLYPFFNVFRGGLRQRKIRPD